MAKLRSSVDRSTDPPIVKLVGVLDEDSELSALASEVPAGLVVIDLSEVQRINSFGVRDWLAWLSKMDKNGTHPVLVGCSPSIVAQINIIEAFVGGGEVRSFFLPYVCPRCDRDAVLLVDVAALGPLPRVPPPFRCEACAAEMEFDDVAERYFAFLSPPQGRVIR